MDTLKFIIEKDTFALIGNGNIYEVTGDVSKLFSTTSFLETVIFGVVTSIFGALIFLFLRYFVKPKLVLSPKCVRRERDGQNIFQTKFYNKSFFNIENVKISLYVCNITFSGGSKNVVYEELEIKDKHFDFITGTNKKNKEVNDNCIVITLDEDLTAKWDSNDKYLELQISASHSISGFRKTYRKQITDLDKSLVNGKFESGQTFEVINVN